MSFDAAPPLDGKPASRLRRRLNRVIGTPGRIWRDLRLSLPSGSEEIRTEQLKELRMAAFVFASLGINTVSVVMIDFAGQAGVEVWTMAGAITSLYAAWIAMAAARGRAPWFMRASILLLAMQGVLWAFMINVLAALARPDQCNFVSALIMAIVSTPMLGSPFSVAMAFWVPVAIGGVLAVGVTLQPTDVYMTTSFVGFVGFTLACIVILNRTLLERSVMRTKLGSQNATVSLLLKEYEENAADWLWETDARLCMRRVTARFSQVLGADAAAIEGVTLRDVIGLNPADDPGARSVEAAIGSREAFRDVPVQVRRGAAETPRWWSLTGRPMSDKTGAFQGYRGVGSDVTDAKRMDEAARYLAWHDSLTGLGNRHSFIEHLTKLCEQDGPDGQAITFALLMIDLDGFKEVNDNYGHPFGDKLLVVVGERLQRASRAGDLVARLGGDEFAVVLLSVEEQQASETAARLIDVIKERVLIEDTSLAVGCSVGIAVHPRDGLAPEEMMRSADLALYRAKASGSGARYVFNPLLQTEFQSRVTLTGDLRVAVAEGALGVEYQPIIDLRTGSVVSIEALCRWEHPLRGTVPPSTFIPLAEECGLIEQIGKWMLDEACTAATGWSRSISVSVNLSPLQFKNLDLADVVASTLAKTGLEPGRLELEVTESAWLMSDTTTTDQLTKLAALGIAVVMDDFGTGFSSLSSLRTFSFQGLKIDAESIREIELDPKARAIVRLVTELAFELGIELTAEGVETEGQLAVIKSLGIPRAQGFLLGCPSDAASVGAAPKRLLAS